MKNRVLDYIEDILYFKKNEDKEGLEALKKEGREKYVTLEEVGFAFLEVVDDLIKYVDVSQAVTEVRLKAIVASLPEATQKLILAKFDEAEDDLFNHEGEEIEYD